MFASVHEFYNLAEVDKRPVVRYESIDKDVQSCRGSDEHYDDADLVCAVNQLSAVLQTDDYAKYRLFVQNYPVFNVVDHLSFPIVHFAAKFAALNILRKVIGDHNFLKKIRSDLGSIAYTEVMDEYKSLDIYALSHKDLNYTTPLEYALMIDDEDSDKRELMVRFLLQNGALITPALRNHEVMQKILKTKDLQSFLITAAMLGVMCESQFYQGFYNQALQNQDFLALAILQKIAPLSYREWRHTMNPNDFDGANRLIAFELKDLSYSFALSDEQKSAVLDVLSEMALLCEKLDRVTRSLMSRRNPKFPDKLENNTQRDIDFVYLSINRLEKAALSFKREFDGFVVVQEKNFYKASELHGLVLSGTLNLLNYLWNHGSHSYLPAHPSSREIALVLFEPNAQFVRRFFMPIMPYVSCIYIQKLGMWLSKFKIRATECAMAYVHSHQKVSEALDEAQKYSLKDSVNREDAMPIIPGMFTSDDEQEALEDKEVHKPSLTNSLLETVKSQDDQNESDTTLSPDTTSVNAQFSPRDIGDLDESAPQTPNTDTPVDVRRLICSKLFPGEIDDLLKAKVFEEWYGAGPFDASWSNNTQRDWEAECGRVSGSFHAVNAKRKMLIEELKKLINDTSKKVADDYLCSHP